MCDANMEFQKLISSPSDVNAIFKFLVEGEWPEITIEGGTILTKDDLREKVKRLDLSRYHSVSTTSGTTGVPVVVPKTSSSQMWFIAANLYDLLRNQWRFAPNDRVVSMIARNKSYHENILGNGCVLYNVPLLPMQEFQDFLEKMQPTHLYTYPSIISQLPSSLLPKKIRSCGENGATSYSSEETGVIALKPEGCSLYHILPNMIVENDRKYGVLVTDLTNPIITNYVLGDVVELGGVCECGKKDGHTISKIFGRVRGMLKLGNGDMIWPTVGEPLFGTITNKIRQHQTVQLSHHEFVLKVVVCEPLTIAEKELLVNLVYKHLGVVSAKIVVEEVDSFPTGKHECFVCLC